MTCGIWAKCVCTIKPILYDIYHMINWSKELWFALLFLTVGFTVWPLMIYYLGLALGLEFFTITTLRVWAEQIIYGPLSGMSLHFFRSLLILLLPYLLFNVLRLLIRLSSVKSNSRN